MVGDRVDLIQIKAGQIFVQPVLEREPLDARARRGVEEIFVKRATGVGERVFWASEPLLVDLGDPGEELLTLLVALGGGDLRLQTGDVVGESAAREINRGERSRCFRFGVATLARERRQARD